MTRKRLMLISAAIAVLVVVCCLIWFLVGFVADILEDYPRTILQTETALEPGQFRIDSTVTQWYDLGVHMLQEHGWDVSPDLTRLYASLQCTSKSQEPVLKNVHMQFADAYFSGIIPGIKFGDVYLRSANETASVEIAYQPLRWRHTSVDTTRIKVDWRQALEIAQQHTGSSFLREAGDRCLVGLALDRDVWEVSYGDSGASSPWIGPTISIDARTGKVLGNP
jgi:hypothetical protein